jgi:predicted ATPase
MISSVKINKVFALQDIEVALEPFTIVTGPNACGKTTFLRCLQSQAISAVDGSVEWTDHTGLVGSQWFDGSGGRRPSGANWYLRSQYLALSSPALRSDTSLGAAMGETGSGLGSVLARVRLEQIDGPQILTDLLGQIIPGVVNVGIEGSRLLPFVEFEHIGKVPADRLSEGTLFALAIVAVLTQPEPPEILLIDDLDKGLHPAAFSELVRVLRAAQVANPKLQIVATTHSPYLLGCFEAKEVRVFARKEDGSAACSKLTDHPDFEHWKDSLDPGEFWASVGEEWVLSK